MFTRSSRISKHLTHLGRDGGIGREKGRDKGREEGREGRKRGGEEGRVTSLALIKSELMVRVMA